ncbi:NYN domain-containing protein [Xanthobacter sp. V3C-3]|uniref:NYN domain-containing protein n=1 Tax=Xanthobacter lutulentifluminis TaxID=3119935 RepID=UPI0037292BDF
MDAVVYIDGFNLFYGQMKGRPNKWLDLHQFAQKLVPTGTNIAKIKYFTARVSGAQDPDAPKSQAIYLKALSTLSVVEVHFGSFLAKTIWRPSINVPIGGDPIACSTPSVTLPIGNHPVSSHKPSILPVGIFPPRGAPRSTVAESPLPNATIVKVHTMEEKGSDVNLAAHLVNDACSLQFDIAVVVSNDTDLITPVRMARQKGKRVIIACPSKSGVATKLQREASSVVHIHSTMLRNSQFPTSLSGGAIQKPTAWL